MTINLDSRILDVCHFQEKREIIVECVVKKQLVQAISIAVMDVRLNINISRILWSGNQAELTVFKVLELYPRMSSDI